MTDTYTEVQVAGSLFVPGIDDAEYFLLYPRPIKKDDWMSDDTNMFYVATHLGVSRHVVIKGPYVIDYWSAGKKIKVKVQEEEEAEVLYDEPVWLKALLQNEPQMLAED